MKSGLNFACMYREIPSRSPSNSEQFSVSAARQTRNLVIGFEVDERRNARSHLRS